MTYNEGKTLMVWWFLIVGFFMLATWAVYWYVDSQNQANAIVEKHQKAFSDFVERNR